MSVVINSDLLEGLEEAVAAAERAAEIGIPRQEDLLVCYINDGV
jgi:hypothetical protein